MTAPDRYRTLPARGAAMAIVAVVFVGFGVLAVVGLVADRRPPVEVVDGVGLMAVVLAVQLTLLSARAAARPWLPSVLVAVQIVAVAVGLLSFGTTFLPLLGFVAGAALLVLPAWAGRVVFAATLLACAAVEAREPGAALYDVLATALTGLVVFGLTRFATLVVELRSARTDLAATAVQRQRLAFSHDLNALLGRRLGELSTIGRQALERLDDDRGAAHADIGSLQGTARRALADVRSIAHRYRRLRVEDELRSLAATLRAAGVAPEVRSPRRPVPPAAGGVLALALREAVTNVLRHTDASRCVITLTESGDRIRLEVTNDGVDGGTAGAWRRVDPGGGLTEMAERLRRMGGETEACSDGDRFRLSVSVPAGLDGVGAETDPGASAEDGPGDRGSEGAEQSVPRRSTRTLATAVVTGFTLVAVIRLLTGEQPPAAAAGSVACMVGLLATVVLLVRRRARLPSSWVGPFLLVQVVLVALPVAWAGTAWISVPGLLIGSALVVLGPLRGGPIAVAALAGQAAVAAATSGQDVTQLAFSLVATINSGLATWGLLLLAGLVTELDAARVALARSVVERERLRFAQDVHDLLGLSLSGIVLKGELAQRLLDRDPGRARREIVELLDAAGRALDEVDGVVGGYRDVPIVGEVDAAARTLRDAGVVVAVSVHPDEVDPEVRAVLVATLREGVTNMLRHARPRHCEIVVDRDVAGSVRLTVTNDGVRRRAGSAGAELDGPGGQGLANLAERVRALGGEIATGERGPRGYRVRAVLPLPGAE